jgi:hypothetical protein
MPDRPPRRCWSPGRWRPGVSLFAIPLLLLVAAECGGPLLNLLTRRIPRYLDNPVAAQHVAGPRLIATVMPAR